MNFSKLLALLALTMLCACGREAGDGFDGGDVDAGHDAGPSNNDVDSGSTFDAGNENDAGTVTDSGVVCPPGLRCVTSFVYSDAADTSDTSLPSQLDGYSCSPSTDESGREVIYRVEVPADGFLSAAVTEENGVDVDVHILSALDASACLSRGNFNAKADVAAGTYYVVIDTFGGNANAGGYTVDIGFIEPSSGACGMETGSMPRVNDNGNTLQMPATGPVVMEAHLVTQDEPPPYPQTDTDELAAHYALSQSRTGLVMHRTQVWAPKEGGGTFFGAGIGSPTTFPVIDEGWYVNMYWTAAARPARGTRMILRLPSSNRAVVVAAGYETGPGDLSAVGGTPEESHFYLGTSHRSTIQLGIATDQTLPFGPRTCSP